MCGRKKSSAVEKKNLFHGKLYFCFSSPLFVPLFLFSLLSCSPLSDDEKVWGKQSHVEKEWGRQKEKEA